LSGRQPASHECTRRKPSNFDRFSNLNTFIFELVRMRGSDGGEFITARAATA